MKAVKEKEQFQKTLNSWKDSSKNLWRLINSGMSSSSKIGLEEIDESLYVYGKKGPQEPEPSVSDDRSSEYSTCQSNDSAGSIGTSSEHSVDLESEILRVPKKCMCPKPITTIEKSLSHLIKDCDYYEKKMAREAEFKKQRVFNTSNGVAKPVWTNANRLGLSVNTGRGNNVNSVRLNVNIGRVNVNSVKSRQPVPTKTSNTYPKRPQVNQLNQRRHFSKSHSPVSRPIVRNTARMTYSHAVKGNWGTAVKTSAGYNWRKTRPNSNYDSRSNFVKTVNVKGPQGRPKPVKAWVPTRN
ncbi:hypothetical protein Tco_0123509 [Tanacetum coccineum]